MKTPITGKRIYSAIAPSGDGTLHIGNYLGAVKQFIELSKTNECFLQLATVHALTTIQDGKKLAHNIEELTRQELALLGDNPNIYFCYQSDVPYHTELQSILNNVTPLGLLKRAHAYKDKLAKEIEEDDINLGLFNYPILMAADILIYKATLVPVGKDQKQHVEITRDIAQRFNRIFKKQVFPIPDPYIPEDVATVMGTDGKRKMSKSLGNIISIFETEEVIKKQVMSTYTDPTRIHPTDPGHIEGNMVFTYLDFFGEKNKVDQLKLSYTKGQIADIEVKEYLYESLIKFFAPARKRYEELKNNPELVKGILARGVEKARRVAGQTMNEVKEAVGLKNAYSLGATKKSVITIDDFSSVEIRVGKVGQAQHVEKSEKLIRLHVDFGDFGKRVIFTGVRTYGYTADDFAGKQFLFVVNLEPRKMMGEESRGMILAVDGADGKPLFVPGDNLPIGSPIR
jgi:tryptophanyl-tRNA synthetase